MQQDTTDPVQRHAAPGAAPESQGSFEETGNAYFPASYVRGFLNFIRDRPADISVLTYHQFPWVDGDDMAAGYPGEHAAWRKGLASGRFDRTKAHIVLHYDVDSVPLRTFNLLSAQAHRGLPAAVMIFNRRVDRRHLKATGEVRFTDYEIDDALLKRLEGEGFVVGYHCNAYEQAPFDERRALEIFDADVRALRARFNVRIFSAHGGAAGPDGRNNRDLPMHPAWQHELYWVHNGHTPHFDAGFSDGGHNSPQRDPARRDLRDFVARLQPGKRYRVLLHPQYYSEQFFRSRRYSGTPWYDQVIAMAEQGQHEGLWSEVRLGAPRSVMKARYLGARKLLGRIKRRFLTGRAD